MVLIHGDISYGPCHLLDGLKVPKRGVANHFGHGPWGLPLRYWLVCGRGPDCTFGRPLSAFASRTRCIRDVPTYVMQSRAFVKENMSDYGSGSYEYHCITITGLSLTMTKTMT